MTTKAPKRPILRYHGGKWLLGKWIISHFPRHRIYTEVYGGAASVLLQKRRAYAEIYNDQWDLVVNIFKVLRDPASAMELKRVLELTPYSRTDYEKSAEAIANCEDPIEKARLLLIRSFQGFGSGSINPSYSTSFRADSKRDGTTAMIDWKNYSSHIESFTKRLQGVTIENRPAIDLLLKHDTDKTLHYVDPPYVLTTRNTSQNAYAFEMTEDDHRELAEVLKSLKGMVVLSGYDCPLYQELYELKGGWTVDQKLATTSNMNKKKTETIWMNQAVSSQIQTELFSQ